MAIISGKITDGKQFLTDFVAVRVTAIRGYFDEVFAKKVHSDAVCLKREDGTEVCINSNQLEVLLAVATSTPTVSTDVPQATTSLTNLASTTESTVAASSTDPTLTIDLGQATTTEATTSPITITTTETISTSSPSSGQASTTSVTIETESSPTDLTSSTTSPQE